MRFVRIFVPLLGIASMGFAQLTPAQKQSDFLQLVGLYAKNYGPYELHRDLIGFDLYNVKPWLDQIAASTRRHRLLRHSDQVCGEPAG